MSHETFYTKTVSKKRKSWTIDKARTALLVIDMQNDFVKKGAILEVPKIRRQIPKIKKVKPLVLEMLPLLEKEGLRDGTEGAEICDELKPGTEDIVVRKMGFSAFYNTELESILRNINGRRQVDTVIICGTVTNICCESTARDAFERDYRVVFGSDVTSAWTDDFQNLTLKNIEYAFGRVMSCDEIIKCS